MFTPYFIHRVDAALMLGRIARVGIDLERTSACIIYFSSLPEFPHPFTEEERANPLRSPKEKFAIPHTHGDGARKRIKKISKTFLNQPIQTGYRGAEPGGLSAIWFSCFELRSLCRICVKFAATGAEKLCHCAAGRRNRIPSELTGNQINRREVITLPLPFGDGCKMIIN